MLRSIGLGPKSRSTTPRVVALSTAVLLAAASQVTSASRVAAQASGPSSAGTYAHLPDHLGIDVRQSLEGVLHPSEAARLALPYVPLAAAATTPTLETPGFERLDLFASLFGAYSPEQRRLLREYAEAMGFTATLFARSDRLVIAFGATHASTEADWATGIIHSLGMGTAQFKLAEYIAVQAAQKYGDLVTFTGHSLGGGLAQRASILTGRPAVVFNSLGENGVVAYSEHGGDRVIAFNSPNDFAGALTQQTGNVYTLPNGLIPGNPDGHFITTVARHLEAQLQDGPRGSAVAWARVDLARGAAVAVVTGAVSHVGTAGGSVAPTAAEAMNSVDAVFGRAAAVAEEQFRVVEGDARLHLGEHGSRYGSLASPTGTTLYSVNNAGVSRVLIEKQFQLQAGATTFALAGFASFVTTEFPEYVGSQFDDRGWITLATPGNLVIPLRASVNGATFTPVTGLPFPMRKGFGPGFVGGDNSGGATPFMSLWTPAFRVAPGGTVTMRVEVRNIGDEAWPSAVVVNGLSAR